LRHPFKQNFLTKSQGAAVFNVHQQVLVKSDFVAGSDRLFLASTATRQRFSSAWFWICVAIVVVP
jgi:hypothetical protein